MDYVLYCVKFQNKYSGYWLTNGNSSIDNIEKAGNVLIETKSLNQSVYHATVDGEQVDLLLTFDNDDNCSITCLTPGKTASGSGSFTDGGAKKSWGNKDRDLMELNYTVDGTTVTESLVWMRSGVKSEEFTPTYN